MKLDLDRVPSTVAGAVDMIIDALEEPDRRFILSHPSMAVHHTTGRYLRNAWSLWENDSPLKRDAVKVYGIAHADDITGLILEWVWHRMRKLDFDPQQFVKRYHAHWRNMGTDALAAGGWTFGDEPSC